MWVASFDAATLTRLRVTDGANLGTFPAGGPTPIAIAFDGANIWVTHHLGNTVTKH
jgi:hypothetical protein